MRRLPAAVLRTSSTGDTTTRGKALDADAVAAEATLQRSAREGFVASAQQLADRIANDHGKKVVVTCRGHDQVPETYRRPVKDVLIQLIRNAVVHGIETPDERQARASRPRATSASSSRWSRTVAPSACSAKTTAAASRPTSCARPR